MVILKPLLSITNASRIGIYDYIAKLDAGEIDPVSTTAETTSQDEPSEDGCDEECETENYWDDGENL